MREEGIIEEVKEILKRELDDIPGQELEKCLQIWSDFTELRDVSNTRKPETWAAAVYYVFSDISFWLFGRTTQREAGERFGVSEGTVQAKQKEIRDRLSIGFIDGRYTPERAIEKFKEDMPPGVDDFLEETFRIEPSVGRESSREDEELYEQFHDVRENLFEFVFEKFEEETGNATEEFRALEPLRSTNGGFVDWFVFDRESSRGVVPAELYVQEEGRSLPKETLNYVKRWIETEDQPYAVEDLNPETGEILLEDLMTNKIYRTVDYNAPKQLERGQVIVTRLFPWFDAYHPSGDMSILPKEIQPVSVEIDLEGMNVDPSKISLMSPLSICLLCLERAKLTKDGELDGLEEALEKSMENVTPGLAELAAGNEDEALRRFERHSSIIQESLDRFGLNVEFFERIDEFNRPLPDELMKEWRKRSKEISDTFEEPENIVGNGLAALLAGARAEEKGRKIQKRDMHWSTRQLLENEDFLKKITDTL